MMSAMFMGVGTASAAVTYSALTVPTVPADDARHDLGTLSIKIDTFSGPATAIVSLPAGFQYTGGTITPSVIVDGGTAPIATFVVSDSVSAPNEATLTTSAATAAGLRVIIPMQNVLVPSGAADNITLDILGLTGQLTTGSVVVGNGTASAAVTYSALSTPTVAADNARHNLGALSIEFDTFYGPASAIVSLPAGFQYTGGTITPSVIVEGGTAPTATFVVTDPVSAPNEATLTISATTAAGLRVVIPMQNVLVPSGAADNITLDILGLTGQLTDGWVVVGNTETISTGSISGQVKDELGNPLPNILVKVYGPGASEESLDYTDASGLYRIAGLPGGEYWIQALPIEDWVWSDSTDVTVTAPNQTSNIDFTLVPGGTISGTVVDGQGNPLAGINVVAQYSTSPGGGIRNCYSEVDGTFRTPGLPSGVFILSAMGIDYVAVDYPDFITINAPNDVTDINFTLLTKSEAIEDFVTRFYTLCLNRQPDQGGLNYWVNALATGQQTGANVAQNFILSDEFTARNLSDIEFLDIMYSAFFNRTADSGGKAYWQGQMDSGLSSLFILSNFVNSREFNTICSGYGITRGSISLTDPADLNPPVTAFVNRFYLLCMGRPADSSGLNYWVDQLVSGQQTGAQLSQGFIFSPEFTSKNLNNSDFITVMYRVFFDREPDSGGQTYWVGLLDSGTSRLQVLAGFVGSNEFATLCSSIGIPVGVVQF